MARSLNMTEGALKVAVHRLRQRYGESVRAEIAQTVASPLAATGPNITFDFKPQHVVLPNTVVYGISYNTSHYGPHPLGESTACYTSSGGCF